AYASKKTYEKRTITVYQKSTHPQWRVRACYCQWLWALVFFCCTQSFARLLERLRIHLAWLRIGGAAAGDKQTRQEDRQNSPAKHGVSSFLRSSHGLRLLVD